MARVFEITIKPEDEKPQVISLHTLRKAFINHPEEMAALLAEVLNSFYDPYEFDTDERHAWQQVITARA